MMTTHPGIFAGGDMVEDDRTVTTSIGHGKKAAKYINAWLRQTKVEPKIDKAPVSFEELNTCYYTDAPHAVRELLDANRRINDVNKRCWWLIIPFANLFFLVQRSASLNRFELLV